MSNALYYFIVLAVIIIAAFLIWKFRKYVYVIIVSAMAILVSLGFYVNDSLDLGAIITIAVIAAILLWIGIRQAKQDK